MKITKARLKEIIMEELQYEGGSKGDGSMADYQLNRIADFAVMIDDLVSDETDLDEWIKSKITIVHTYLGDILDYLKGRRADAEEDEMSEMGEENVEDMPMPDEDVLEEG